MSDTRTIAHNTISQVLARIIALLASFAVIPILTRYLGPDLYGIYSLVLVLNSFLINFTDLGIQTIATREASRRPEEAEFYSSQALLLRLISTLVIVAISIFVIFLTPYQEVIKVGFTIAAASVIFNAIQAGLTVFLQARLKIYLASLADMIGRIASTAFILLAIFLAAKLTLSKDAGLYLILLGVGVGSAVAALGTLILSLRSRVFRARFDRDLAKAILRDSIPLWIVSIFSLVNYRIDTILLSILKGPYDVGIYNLSYKLLDITLTFPAFFMSSVFPLLSRKLDDRPEFVNFARRAFDAMVFGAVPIGIGIFAIAPQTIAILGGAQFAASTQPLRILAIAGIFSFLSQFMIYMLVIKNQQKILLAITVFVAATNIILNLIFIPSGSYNAAAVVTLISEILMALLLFIATMRVHRFRWHLSTSARIILAALAMLAVITFTPTQNVLLLIPLAAIVYLGSSYLLRAFDLQTVREILSRRPT